MTRRLVLFLVAFSLHGSVTADPGAISVTQTLKRDFQARGQATMDRLDQDALQRVCTRFADQPPAALAKLLEADQMKTITFPAGSLLGDWKRGEAIAQSGRGASWSDARGAAGGGSCYNCHQLSPQEASHGTLGPSLLRFGKLRGNGPEIQKYAYGKIYNAKAYNLCSQMPRLGHSGTLTEQQIKDLVALLLDAESPVNK
ncbi:MAG: sulfur oxidation c-type cytochrome SoxX [Pseudomonadota bacterium]